MNTDLEHLSYSSITNYLYCPQSWKRKYLDKAPTFSTPELVFGTAWHGTVQAAIQGDGTRLLVDLWREQWQKAITEPTELELMADPRRRWTPIVWMENTPETFENDGIKMLSSDVVKDAVRQMFLTYVDGQIEQKVELRVPGVPVPIVGYIDVVSSSGKIGDIKTSKASWTPDKAASELQSLFYLAALNQAGVNTHNWTFTHHVFVKTKTPQYQELKHSHKPTEIFWLFGMIQKIWAGIEAGVFPENPTGWKCGPKYCDFWSDCRGKYV